MNTVSLKQFVQLFKKKRAGWVPACRNISGTSNWRGTKQCGVRTEMLAWGGALNSAPVQTIEEAEHTGLVCDSLGVSGMHYTHLLCVAYCQAFKQGGEMFETI